MPEGHRDPFETLGLPARFDLQSGEVERAFLTRAAAAHPDAGAGDLADATARMAHLTDAKRVLADPEHRANALLLALGGPSKEADRSLPDGFLMDIMQTRQEIEAELPEQRDKWAAWADEQRGHYADRVRALFAAHAESGDAGVLAEIRTELNAWRYIERLIEQLDPDYDPNRADFAPGG